MSKVEDILDPVSLEALFDPFKTLVVVTKVVIN